MDLDFADEVLQTEFVRFVGQSSRDFDTVGASEFLQSRRGLRERDDYRVLRNHRTGALNGN